MVSINQLTLGFFILQIYVSAAPVPASETADKEVTRPTEKEDPKLDDESAQISSPELNENNSMQTQRQKRYYSFGFSSFNPYYTGYNRRDISQDVGTYGVDDPLNRIHRHLLQIAAVARQPPPPPPPPINFPFWLPIIYIPQTGCNCIPNKQPPRPGQNTTGNPGVETRFPELEDERLNWGIVNNDNNDDDYDFEEDFSRPISFDPITVNTPMKRPPPPVEHGTTQGDQSRPQGSTTARPRPPLPPMSPPRNPPQNTPATGGAPFAAPYPSSFAERPTTCDAAILSCCHQVQVTFTCFSLQGCPDPRRYGQSTNPCDPGFILKIVEKYQKFYGQGNG